MLVNPAGKLLANYPELWNNHQSDAVTVAFQPAQQRTPEEMAKHETGWMRKELTLTPEQVSKVDSINLVYANKLQALRQQYQGNHQELRSRRAELEIHKRTDLSLVLTPDQLQKYDDALAARREQRQNQRGN